MNLQSILKDLRSFADSDADVEIEQTGQVVLTRGGELIDFCLKENDSGKILVEYKGNTLTYKDFLAKEIAKLDLFAQRIIEKRRGIEPFIDGPSKLTTPWNQEQSTALKLLDKECTDFLFSGTKISFITADAGHGKTALLKQYQVEQATKYLNNESSFLFWHVDLQGRDLVRLAEAIMYDLGELRITGLFFPSILTLIRNKHIVLAIDGFDELAAEIGGDSALGALSSLVLQMEQSGTLIAASRRTFFDTQDYLRRANFLKGKISQECVFDEIKVQDWKKEQVLEYLSYHYSNSEEVYKQMLIKLQNNECHPVLCRPFLLTKVVSGAQSLDLTPAEFMSGIEYGSEGVASVVESFTKREVTKWKERDKVTGKPYLTYEQHIEMLSVFAREMWENQKDTISIEEMEFWGTLLIDSWKIHENSKPLVIRMLKSHALLIPPNDDKPNQRKFDHEEFKNYFLARSFAKTVNEDIESESVKNINKFLYESQLPDSVAKYFTRYLKDSVAKIEIINTFLKVLKKEWKPTHLQSNVGTILPFLLDGNGFNEHIELNAKATYSSLVFEGKTIKNVNFQHGTFVNVSLNSTKLEDVIFKNCAFSEIRIETNSKNRFKNVKIIDSEIGSIVICKDGDMLDSAYSPDRIIELLSSVGITIQEGEEKIVSNYSDSNNEFKKSVNRFLSKFNRALYQYEKSIQEQSTFGASTRTVIEKVIPLLSEYKIIELADSKTVKQVGGKAWKLTCDLSKLLKADNLSEESEFLSFWKAVNKNKN